MQQVRWRACAQNTKKGCDENEKKLKRKINIGAKDKHMTDKNAELQYFIGELHDSRQHWEFRARANEETTQQLQSDQCESKKFDARHGERWFRYEEKWQAEEEEQNGEQEDSINPDIFAADGVFAARTRKRS